MAIYKKGFRKITVNDEVFLWKVRKKISHNEGHNVELGIPVQHESEGQILIIYLGYCRSRNYGRESVESITPAMIRQHIEEAIELGWKFKEPGQTICLMDHELTYEKL